MINLDLIDKLIAVVVVILALTLFVQSLQALLKKVLKLKSLQIEQSLVHLFYYVLEDKTVLNKLSGITDHSPFLRYINPLAKHPADHSPEVSALYHSVATEFKRVGRLTWKGKLMLDSVSKQDLTKFLDKVPAGDLIGKLYPGAVEELATVGAQLRFLDEAMSIIQSQSQSLLNPDELASLEKLISDIKSVFGESGINSQLIIGDILDLKQINPEQLLADLKNAQDQIGNAIAKLKTDPNATAAANTLGKALDGLKVITAAVSKLSASVNSLRAIVDRVNVWFDTVMQSFDERYNRSMKTVTLIICALVVILLNANIINIYREISTNDARRSLVLQTADRYRASQTNQNANTNQTAVNGAEDLEKLYEEGRSVINKNIADYTSLGFKGPSWMLAVPDWIKGTGFYANPEYHSLEFRFWQAARTVIGWLIMTLLLSAGAPFWQDTLESLFGLKNLLRKQSDTSNVATVSGAGQPKP